MFFIEATHRQVYCTTCLSGVFFCRSHSSSGVLYHVSLRCVLLSEPLIIRYTVLRVSRMCSFVGATHGQVYCTTCLRCVLLSEQLIVRCIVLRVSQVCTFVGATHCQVYCTTCFSGVFFCWIRSSSGVLYYVFFRCVLLSEPLRMDARSSESWNAVLTRFRHMLLASYSRCIDQYEEHIRAERERRTDPVWSFCDYFVLQVLLTTV